MRGLFRLIICSLLIGYVIAWLSFFPFIRKHQRILAADPDGLQAEKRLEWLLWLAPLETIGLFAFAWTSLGPPHVHWIAPLIFSAFVGIANVSFLITPFLDRHSNDDLKYAIYMATIDYMIAAYGPYSASATGGNGLARDFLAGVAALYSTPFYEVFKNRYQLEIPSTILGGIAILVTIPIYVFYWKGPQIRAKSKFAQVLASDRKTGVEARKSLAAQGGRRKSTMPPQGLGDGPDMGGRASVAQGKKDLEKM